MMQQSLYRTGEKRANISLPLLVGCLTVLICLACTGLFAGAGVLFISSRLAAAITDPQTSISAEVTVQAVNPLPTHQVESGPKPDPERPTLPAEEANGATNPAGPVSFEPPPGIKQQLSNDENHAFLSDLLQADYPARDYFDSAARLGKKAVGQRTTVVAQRELGDHQTFIVDRGRIEAELMAITNDAYFWVETGLAISQNHVADAARRFQEEYLPRVNKLLGQEWRPGMDGDPHFSVLHLDGFEDDSELGYFDSGDEYPRTISSTSNEQEIVYLNMDNMRIGDALYFGTLVHELQHLVQWHHDANESIWLNEGFSQLAELYAGLDTVDAAEDYLQNPETPLNSWAQDDEEVLYAHYGAAYLFSVYLWEQLGEQAIGEIARHPANGLAALNDFFNSRLLETSVENFLADWAVANYLDDEAAGLQYHYASLALAPASPIFTVEELPFNTLSTIDQFAVNYGELNLSGEVSISFAADTVTELIAVPPHSGERMWFVPPMNEVDAQLTGSFDLRGLSDAHLEFWTWYDLEEEFDFAYIELSPDQGQSWELLMPSHAVAGEFGPALSGRSQKQNGSEDGWVFESISLAPYSGQKVLIRFEVLTDSAINGNGFALDDLAIPELGYATDLEQDEAGWSADGFVRGGWKLPQLWEIRLIKNGSIPQVVPLDLDVQNQGQWRIDLGPDGGTLVVVAVTPFGNQPAAYWLQVEP